ncbi:MAG: TlpA disulfide reductase family protein [Terriglobales bacterium]
MRRNLTILMVVAMAVTGMLWFGARRARQGGADSLAVGSSRLRGKAAPDFTLTDLSSNQHVNLSDFKGKAVVLNFWATWCSPCKVEIPWFVDLQKEYGPQGLQIIGVAMDDTNAEIILKFAHDMGINYPVLQGTEKVADLYGGMEVLPTTFYLDRDGKISQRVFGLASHGEVEDSVKSLLKQASPQTTAQAARGALP